MPEIPDQKGKQGFASIDKEKQKEIASKGGRAAHEKGTAHEFIKNDPKHKASEAAKKNPNRHKFTSESAKAMWAKKKAEKAAARNANGENTTAT